MFDRLGTLIARRPCLIILVWVVVLVGAIAWTVTAEPRPPADIDSFLPADSPHNQAVRLIRETFPKLAARSQIVIIACRAAGMGADDFQWLDRAANTAGALTEGRFLSPAVAFLKPRLVSPDRQAAMAVVSLSTNFVSTTTKASVERVEQALAASPPPAGLTVEITGTAGIGRDYAVQAAHALDNTTWVTVVAVLGILVLVYRSPIGAFVPLASVGVSVYLAFVMLALLARAGWAVSDIERIFAVVLLFGAGVDYAMFWISRYRESLGPQLDFDAAAITATRQTGPSILTSACTTICGLSMMITTTLVPTRNAGKVLAAVLVISLLAALTLAPAMARRLGRALFWPVSELGRPSIGQRLLWPVLARHVAKRPLTCLLFGTVLLGGLALYALGIAPRFDAISELPPGTSSARGYEIAKTHFSKGQLYSNTLLLRFDSPPGGTDALRAISQSLTNRIAEVEGVYDVYALDAPLGRRQAAAVPLVGPLLSSFTREFYLAADANVLRFEVLSDHEPFTPQAMALIENVETIAKDLFGGNAGTGPRADVLLAGPTPYMIAVREIASHDLRRVMVLATVVIALVVLALIRDVPLTIFMLLATWLTFGATLTLSDWFFVHVMGLNGLDWKVRLIVFVIVVAVGQDYNIFLVTRLLAEPPELSDAEAARRAIVSTGGVISSCGLIMAATLGSLWAGGLSLLQQTGFTLALGILIDTFFVRPLLVPSFFLATGRKRRHPRTAESVGRGLV